ncbi:hypothetical protein GOV10_06310 [Candidatus Woesearchaeota archaeon]|nr:hypothetical protein [Candidatus Woesearchaeota archaeon]
MRSGKIEGTEYTFGAINLPEDWSFPKSRLTFQLVDPKTVFGEKHLLVSIYTHLKGFRLAKDRNMNLLLRISGFKQIKEAIKFKPKRKAVLVVVGKNAKKEYKKLIVLLGAKESGKITARKNELDAIERTALVGI